MPEQEVIERAKRDKEEGKSPSTQAGAFVCESMALPTRNRPSPSVFQRLVAQEWDCRSRAKVVDRKAPAKRRAATVEKALKEIEEPRPEHARERCSAR